jgi:hypothetical protein
MVAHGSRQLATATKAMLLHPDLNYTTQSVENKQKLVPLGLSLRPSNEPTPTLFTRVATPLGQINGALLNCG